MSLIRGRSGRTLLVAVGATVRQAPRFLTGYLARRDRRTWVAGNVHGFRDSPRYLAEHVVAARIGVEMWWIARDADSGAAAKAAGLKVAMAGSAQARRVQRRAGVAFFTHGFRDVDLALVSGAFVVYLYHGTPLKRVGLDVIKKHARRRSLSVRLVARLLRAFHHGAHRLVDMYVAAGGLERERFISAFGARPDRVLPMGSPRFDVIRGGAAYDRVVVGDLRQRLGYAPRHRLIVWLPTHRREYGDAAWLPKLTSEQLDAALGDDSDIRLLVKTHPNADWETYRERLPDDPRVRLLREAEVDVNALLHIADGLVSDYSSVFFDYSILGRPIWFFVPDLERYDIDRGLYDSYDVVTGGRHHADWPSLLRALRAEGASMTDGEGLMNAERVAAYLRNNTEPETCRRITETILSLTAR
ncbi:MAG: CDP-glycerol glycerophosphotransferase family protein [Chloroflexota bacterium]